MKRLPSGARLDVFETIDSTSLEAKRRAESGDVGPIWFLAKRQTAGYGRRGSSWEQREGDLAASLLFRPQFTDKFKVAAQISLIAAVAIRETLLNLTPTTDIRLKWPNDLLVRGAKLSGILLETAPSDNLVLGVGVNVVSAPELPDYPTARLIDFLPKAPPSPEALLKGIDEAFDAFLGLAKRDGFAPIIDAWLGGAYGLGKAATLTTAGETFSGTVLGLAGDGSLLMETASGTMEFAAGSLRFDS